MDTKSSSVSYSAHPVVAAKLTALRDVTTSPTAFRTVLRELTTLLGYEATSALSCVEREINTPRAEAVKGHAIRERVSIVPILRAGLGMTDAMADLLGDVPIHHLGVYSGGGSMLPVEYYNRLPAECSCEIAYAACGEAPI